MKLCDVKDCIDSVPSYLHHHVLKESKHKALESEEVLVVLHLLVLIEELLLIASTSPFSSGDSRRQRLLFQPHKVKRPLSSALRTIQMR